MGLAMSPQSACRSIQPLVRRETHEAWRVGNLLDLAQALCRLNVRTTPVIGEPTDKADGEECGERGRGLWNTGSFEIVYVEVAGDRVVPGIHCSESDRVNTVSWQTESSGNPPGAVRWAIGTIAFCKHCHTRQ